ncbi:MAG: TlyA family RNA methyltransferase [Pyrinomonadaceae bacterium]
MKKERIDTILETLGFADSPAKAKALVMSGTVLVNEQRVEKPSETFPSDAAVRIKGDSRAAKYVSRGGVKLERALADFEISPQGLNCLDVGSSTGGFTDCLLQNGAIHVTCVDAGRNQLDWKLRNDPRVEVREHTNARNVGITDFDSQFDLIVIDVSFISITKILRSLVPLLRSGGNIISLIKPQFEVRRGEVGEGGIVVDPEKHQRVVAEANAYAETLGLMFGGTIESPILGARGNREFFSLYAKR